MLHPVRTVPVLPRLFCLVGPEHDLGLLPELALAGVDGFQVRAKTGTDRELLALAELVVAATRPHGAVVVVDDRVDVALAVGADGVHVGAQDLPVAVVRRLAPDLLVGATCRDGAAVARAAEQGADYAGLGPIRATTTKTGLPEPVGPAALTRARAASRLPLVAIGGLDAEGAREARAHGAHGAAVLAAVWSAADPLAAARELVAAVA